MKKSFVLVTTLWAVLSLPSCSLGQVTVQLTTPTNGATVTSPVPVKASAKASRNITGWRIYVDGVSVYHNGSASSISTNIAMSTGTHRMTVRAWASNGANGSSTVSLTDVQPPSSTVAVAISPTAATVQSGLTQQFSATVTGSTNTSVSWSVNGTQGGNSTVGTISSTGLYTAPAAVPSGASVTVAARSLADSTKSAAAAVTIVAAPTTIGVTISPTSASLQCGATQQFTATVTGTTNTSALWSVNGVQGGNSTVGTISSAGLYTAPAAVPSGGSVTVKATSAYDTTRSASAAVTISPSSTPVTVSISPTSTSVQTSQTKQFTATVSGTQDTSTVWFVNGAQGGNSTVGTVSSAGLYTAPAVVPSGGSVTVKAQSAYDATKSASATVTITAASGTNYYVSTAGSDSNPCTAASPCATINSVNSRLGSSLPLGSGGTTVHVAPGSYAQSVNTTASGTATARIRYISDTRWGARITGNGSGGVMWSLRGSYTDVVGFEFDGSLANYCCGIASYSTTNLRILNNKIHDTARSGGSTGTAVILLNADVSSSSITTSSNLVEGNLIYHNNGGASGSTPNNGAQHGIYSQVAGDTIRNNIVADQGGGWCIHSWHKVTKWTVTNNTVLNCPNGGIVLGDDSSTGVTHNYDTITNNIVVNSGNSSTGNGGIDMRACGSGNVVQNNLMYGNIPSNYVGSCGGATLSGTQTGSNSTTFVNYTGTGSGDYRLPSGSAAIDHGTTTCAGGMSPCVPNLAFDGGTRPQGLAIDIGAYEFNAVSALWPW